MKQNGLPLFFILVFMITIEQASSFRLLYPLAGTWKMEAGGKVLYEDWQIKTDTEMHGRSYKVNANDTLILEDVQLIDKQNLTNYKPIVTGQNGGEAVSFKLVASANQRFVFENPQHDFPQRVIYHMVNTDSLHAWIEGRQNGKEKRSDFYYRRVK